MNPTGNTILITGGGSGIGRGLAEALHRLGNTVIIAGRRQAVLDEVVTANPGMHALTLDVESAEGVESFAATVAERFPALNVLVNNAGIMRAENLLEPQSALADAEAIVATNLLGPIRLTAALLPLLRKQPKATVMFVSSGLAFVPLALTPTYSATKAAIHAYSESMRYQLKNTPVEVLELVPPYVQTELMGGAEDPRAMPLADFIQEAVGILTGQPDAKEINVQRVHPLRYAERNGAYDATFKGLNDAMAGGH
ncbi:putative oxidoreductase [compost metagenome]